MKSPFFAAAHGIFDGTEQTWLRPNDITGFLNTKQVYANVHEVVSLKPALYNLVLLPILHGFSDSRAENIRLSGKPAA